MPLHLSSSHCLKQLLLIASRLLFVRVVGKPIGIQLLALALRDHRIGDLIGASAHPRIHHRSARLGARFVPLVLVL
jgi:hypothetical protein